MNKLTKKIADALGVNELNPINEGYQNDVYSYIKNDAELIARATPSKSKHIEMIRSEIEWIQVLSENGVSVAKPASNLIETIMADEEHFYITVFEKANGKPANVSNPAEWNQGFFKEWGRIIGKMHALAKKHSNKSQHRPMWTKENPDIHSIKEALPTGMKGKYEKLLNLLKDFSIQHDTYGLIHNDFHQGNFFIDGNQMTIFDFDDCAYNWFAYDIAVSFYHAYWQNTSFNPENKNFTNEFLNNLFEGYRIENTLHKDIIKQIPILLKIRELFLYQLFMKKWELTNLEDWQRYTLEDMKFRIENDIPYADIEIDKFSFES